MSGFAFPIGATTVRCTATDPGNNTASRSFTITVTAAPPLSVVCPADIVTTTDRHACSAVVDYPRPSVAIRPSGATVQCLPASGSTFPKGNTTVTCTATDTSGNTGSCSFTVTVNDVEPPVLTCPSDLTVPCLGQVPPPSMAGSVTDNCDSNPVVMHVGDAVADSASVST